MFQANQLVLSRAGRQKSVEDALVYCRDQRHFARRGNSRPRSASVGDSSQSPNWETLSVVIQTGNPAVSSSLTVAFNQKTYPV